MIRKEITNIIYGKVILYRTFESLLTGGLGMFGENPVDGKPWKGGAHLLLILPEPRDWGAGTGPDPGIRALTRAGEAGRPSAGTCKNRVMVHPRFSREQPVSWETFQSRANWDGEPPYARVIQNRDQKRMFKPERFSAVIDSPVIIIISL